MCERLREAPAISIDAEWEAPTRAGGRPGKVAMVQLATPSKAYVVNLFKLGGVPPTLCALLGSNSIQKVGLNVKGDLTRLHKDWELKVSEPIIDLGTLMNQTFSLNTRWSLAKLLEVVAKQKLDKDLGGGGRFIRWETVSMFDLSGKPTAALR